MRNFLVGVIVFLVMVFCFLFQSSVLNAIPLFGAIANIGIVLVVSLGILTGKKVGVTVGISYGLIMDILYGKAVGLYTMLFFLIGLFCGKISYSFSKENKSSIIMIVAISTVIYEIVCYMLFMIIYGYDFAFFTIVWKTILECIYNIFIAIIFFKPLSFLAEIINKGKRSYYLL